MSINQQRASETITVAVQLTKQDYKAIHRGQFWRSLGWTVVAVPLFALVPVWRAPALRGEVFRGESEAVAQIVGICAGVAMFLAFAIELCARSFTSHAVRKAAAALRPQTLTFSEYGLRVDNASGTKLLKWTEFDRAVERGNGFELYAGRARALFIPAAKMETHTLAGIRLTLRRELGERAKVKLQGTRGLHRSSG